MKRSIISLYEAMEDKLSGYVSIANYRYMNLCVKAEEVSLLSVRVNIEGEEKNIEDVAQVSKKGDYQFVAIPNYSEDLMPLAGALPCSIRSSNRILMLRSWTSKTARAILTQ